MRIPIVTINIVFLIFLLSLGYPMWGSEQWLYAIPAGFALTTLWWLDKRVGSLLGLIGILMLIAIVFGLVQEQSEASRAHFNGAGVGMLIGFIANFIIHWRSKGKNMLIFWMRFDGFEKAATFIESFYR